MTIFARFQAIDENHKASVVRRLIESSTPDFDFFYLSGLAVLMATFGLLEDSAAIVIGSMLIAPMLYPILGVALGLVMSDQGVLGRSLLTLAKSLGLGLGLSVLATIFLGNGTNIETLTQVMDRTEASLLSVMVAIIAGLAVSFALAKPEWNESLPGVAISVALIPPLAVVGIGIAKMDIFVMSGSAVLLLVNIIGIVFSAMVSFSLMNLYEKRSIAESTIKKENERLEEEKQIIDEINKNGTKPIV